MRIIWRMRILGFICGCCLGVAFATYAGDSVGHEDIINWLWGGLAGAMGIAGWLVKGVMTRVTQRVDLHDSQLGPLSLLPIQVARIDDEVRQLLRTAIDKNRWEDFIADWREFRRDSQEWREKIEEKIDQKQDK